MRTAKLRDGTQFEWTSSDTYSGPDGKPGCQRTSMNVPWVRFDGQPWQQAPCRSMIKLLEIASISDSQQEFMELIELA